MQSHNPDYVVSCPGSGEVLGPLRLVSSATGFFWPARMAAGSSSGFSSGFYSNSYSGSSSSSSPDDESGGELAGESLLLSTRSEYIPGGR